MRISVYQHREIIQLKDVIWDSRVFQTVGSGYNRLYMRGSHMSITDQKTSLSSRNQLTKRQMLA